MQKETVTLPREAVETIRSLVASGKADSVSGFVQHALQVSLDDITGSGAMLAQALDETGGALTAEDRAWASGVLGLEDPTNVA